LPASRPRRCFTSPTCCRRCNVCSVANADIGDAPRHISCTQGRSRCSKFDAIMGVRMHYASALLRTASQQKDDRKERDPEADPPTRDSPSALLPPARELRHVTASAKGIESSFWLAASPHIAEQLESVGVTSTRCEQRLRDRSYLNHCRFLRSRGVERRAKLFDCIEVCKFDPAAITMIHPVEAFAPWPQPSHGTER
jgi:hypothetical protein